VQSPPSLPSVIVLPRRTVVSDPSECRYPSRQTLSFTSASISYWGDVRTIGTGASSLRLFFVSVYCNSLLATLNVRNAIRGKGRDDLGISLRPISDSNTSTVDDNRKVDGSVVPAVPPVFHRCSHTLVCRKSMTRPRMWGFSRPTNQKDNAGVSMPTIAIDVPHSFSQHETPTPGSPKERLSLNLCDHDIQDEHGPKITPL
jgi:hypothetical protein